MNPNIIFATATVIVLILFLCSRADKSPAVKWENYTPELKERIDKMVVDKNCEGLEMMSEVAYKNDQIQRARTKTGNGNLIQYIEEGRLNAGCYKK